MKVYYIETIQKNIDFINKKQKNKIILEVNDKNNNFNYTIRTKTPSGHIVQIKGFENIEQLHYYIDGILYSI